MRKLRNALAVAGLFGALLRCDVGPSLGAPPQAPPTTNSAYGNLCEAPVRRLSAHVLSLCGNLDEANVRSLLGMLSSADSEIEITSFGGDPIAAARLAQVIRDRGIALRLRHFCHSACAHFVFMTAPYVTVEPTTLISFHHTPSLLHDIFAAHNLLAEAPILAQQQTAVADLYQASGLDLRFLYWPGLAADLFCIGLEPEQYGGGGVGGVVKRWIATLPPKSVILAVRGRPVTGSWVETESELIVWRFAMTRVGINSARFTMSFDWSPDWEKKSLDELRADLARVPICRTQAQLEAMRSEALNKMATQGR